MGKSFSVTAAVRSVGKWAGVGFGLWLLVACAGAPQVPMDPPRPAWIDAPGDGASASAGFHVRGRAAQEELAVARARTEFARRYGVEVFASVESRKTELAGASHTKGETSLKEVVDQGNVKAVVREKWYDRGNDTVWVWVGPP